MKTHYLIIMTGIAIISVILNIILLDIVDRPRPINRLFTDPVFIWNDDLEGIPSDGSTIIIEKTINDTIYLGVNEAKQ